VVQVIPTMQILSTRPFRNQVAGFRKFAHRRFQFFCDVGRYDKFGLANLLKFFHGPIVPQVGV
jgi:hypothetical protein